MSNNIDDGWRPEGEEKFVEQKWERTEEEKAQIREAFNSYPSIANEFPSEDNPPCACLDPDWYNYTVELCDACEELVNNLGEEELEDDCSSKCKCKQPSSPGSKYDTRGRLLQ